MSNALQITTTEAESAILDRLAEFDGLSVEEVHARLAAAFRQTVDGLKDAAACVRYLLEQGEDLSYVPSDLLSRLRHIAYGQLLAEVVFQFAGAPAMAQTIGRLALPDQKRLADGGKVKVAVRRGDGFTDRMMAPLEMTADQRRQVFAHDRIRSIPEQVALLEATPTPEPEPAPERRPSARIKADPRTDTVQFGRTVVAVKDVFAALGQLAPIVHKAEGPGGSVTIDADLYGPLQRMAVGRGMSVKHLVRLILERALFPDEA